MWSGECGGVTLECVCASSAQILLELISGLPSYDPRRNPKDLVSPFYMSAQ